MNYSYLLNPLISSSQPGIIPSLTPRCTRLGRSISSTPRPSRICYHIPSFHCSKPSKCNKWLQILPPEEMHRKTVPCFALSPSGKPSLIHNLTWEFNWILIQSVSSSFLVKTPSRVSKCPHAEVNLSASGAVSQHGVIYRVGSISSSRLESQLDTGKHELS